MILLKMPGRIKNRNKLDIFTYSKAMKLALIKYQGSMIRISFTVFTGLATKKKGLFSLFFYRNLINLFS